MRSNHFVKSLLVCLFLLAASFTTTAAPHGNDWAMRLDGIGPLRIGMDFNSANRLLGGVLKRTPPELMATEGCDYLPVKNHPGLALMFVNDVLKRVDLSNPRSRTDGGLAIGDKVERVRSLYPSVTIEPNPYEPAEQYLTATSADGLSIRFETRDGIVSQFYAGASREVQFTEHCL